MRLQSPRLTLREFQPEDYHLFSSVFSNPAVMQYAYMDCITNEDAMLSFFNKVMENNIATQKRANYEFAVFLSETKEFIGFADVEIKYHHTKAKHGEIGYFLLPQYWGRGFAVEIAQTLIEQCFEQLNLHKVVASCNADNYASEKVMKKVGMIREGKLRKERYKNGKWDDELRYGILIGEWVEKVDNGGDNGI